MTQYTASAGWNAGQAGQCEAAPWMPLSKGPHSRRTGGRRDRNAIESPVASLHPEHRNFKCPDKGDRPLRGHEFKGADVADGSKAGGPRADSAAPKRS